VNDTQFEREFKSLRRIPDYRQLQPIYKWEPQLHPPTFPGQVQEKVRAREMLSQLAIKATMESLLEFVWGGGGLEWRRQNVEELHKLITCRLKYIPGYLVHFTGHCISSILMNDDWRRLCLSREFPLYDKELHSVMMAN